MFDKYTLKQLRKVLYGGAASAEHIRLDSPFIPNVLILRNKFTLHDTDFDLDNYNFLFRNLDEKKLYHILNLADNYILDYNAKFNVKLGKNSFFKELEGIFVEQNLTNILSNLYSDK
jgi:hypothetical protein